MLAYTVRIAVALMPLIVTPWTLYPFAFGKALFLHTMSIVMASCIVPICVDAAGRRQLAAIMREPLVMCWMALVMVLSISSLLGSDFSTSWWGTQERGVGVVLFLELTIMLIVLRMTHRSPQEKIVLTRWIVISGVVTSLLAFIRLAGITLFGVDTGLRLSGTIANPIFFAGTLIFYLFFGWYGYRFDEKKGTKKWYVGAMTVLFIAIVSTQTRSIMLALIAGGVAAAITAWLGYAHRRRYVLAGIAMVTVVVLLAAVNRAYIIEKNIPFFARIVGTSLSDASLSSRVAAWKGGFNAWTEKPIWGWGVEQFTPAFDAHYVPELLMHGLSATRFDRAHNIIIEMLVMGGIAGLLLYVMLFAWPIYHLTRTKKITQPIGVATIAVIIAHHTHLMFAFDTPVSYPLVLIFLVWVTTHGENQERSATHEWTQTQTYTSIIVIIMALAGIYRFVIQPHNNSSALLHVLVQAEEGQRAQAHEQLMHLLTQPTPYPTETRIEVVRNIIRGIAENKLPEENVIRYIEQARVVGEMNMADHPKESFYPYLNGVLMYHAATIDPVYYAQAHDYFDSAIAISARQQYMFVKAELYEKQGNLEEALKVYRQAVALSDRVPISKWYAGLTLVQLGQKDEGVELIFEALEQGYAKPEVENNQLLAQLLHEHGKFLQAAQYYSYAIETEAKNGVKSAQQWAEFAIYLRDAGYVYSSSQAARMAIQLDPSYAQEAEMFMGELKNVPETDTFASRIEELIRFTQERP